MIKIESVTLHCNWIFEESPRYSLIYFLRGVPHGGNRFGDEATLPFPLSRTSIPDGFAAKYF